MTRNSLWVTKRLCAVVGLLTLLFSCNNTTPKPDVSKLPDMTPKAIRWDKELYSIDTNHIANNLDALKSKYPDFTDFYLDTIMGYGLHGTYSDTMRAVREWVHEYLTYKDYKALQDTINAHYPNLNPEIAAIKSAQQLMYYYLGPIPNRKIYFLNLLLSNHPAFIKDSLTACIALDMFLGGNYPNYANVGLPQYLSPHFSRAYIPVAYFSAEYEDKHPLVLTDKSLLELMIDKGKEIYFLHSVLPDAQDSVLLGFTTNQINWCDKNEAMIYNFFAGQNLLYEKELRKIRPYITDGPFAKGIGSATDEGHPTPGNIGSYCGYKIVSAYMKHNEGKVSLAQLLQNKIEPQALLQAAQYKPKM